MGRKTAVPVTLRLAEAILRFPAGVAAGSVSQLCRELGISRQTFYKYRRRLAAEGLDGMAPRSRRPRSSPAVTGPEMVESIVRARKQLEEEGWDNGAVSIHARLALTGMAVPSSRTVHRVLVREGLVVPDPAKRPRSSLRRFEFPATDDCWQIDALEFDLSDKSQTTVVIFELIDDHSRFEVSSLAWPLEDTAGAWTVFSRALEAGYGPPAMVLSDNGTAFTGKYLNRIVRFEKNLAALGVQLINSRPYHPQTCGKNERAHRTLRRWLRLHHPTTIAELQTLLDAYRPLFNDRPHQGIEGKTPTQRRLSGLRRTPRPNVEVSLPSPIKGYTFVVSSRGVIHHSTYQIRLGTEYAGQTVTAYRTGLDMIFFYRDHLIATITIDPTRINQPTTNNHQGKRTSLPQ